MTNPGVNHSAISGFRRINVVGTSGSGKSTFARKLARLLDLPYWEMDQLFWNSGWRQSTDMEFFPRVEAVVESGRWVLDGNYSRTTQIKWSAVELVIWIDLSFVRTVTRVTWRAIRRSFSKRELWPGTGNRESLVKAFLSRDSIILWAMTSYRRNRRKYRAIMKSPEYAHIDFLRLTTPRAVAGCLEGLGRSGEE